MANDDIIQVISDAREDAVSLSQFMYYPATVVVNRRLAPPIHTLNYYLQYLEGLEKVYSQPTGTVEVNGEVVKTVRQAINDAIDSAILGDYQGQLETELGAETLRAINRENEIEDALESEVIRASDAESTITQDLSDLNLVVDAQKLDTGITVTAKNGGVDRTQAEKNLDKHHSRDMGIVPNIADDQSAKIVDFFSLSGDLTLEEGLYYMGTAPYNVSLQSNTHIKASGAILDYSDSTNTTTGYIKAYGANVLQSYMLSADAEKFGNTLKLNITSGLNVGDILYIKSETIWSSDAKQAEIVCISSINGNEVTLTTTLQSKFAMANTAVELRDIKSNITLDGLTLIGSGLQLAVGGKNERGVQFNNVANCEIRNVKVFNFDRTGIMLADAYNTNIRQCTVGLTKLKEGESYVQYCISLADALNGGTVEKCITNQGRHGIVYTTYSGYGYSVHHKVHDNIISNTNNCGIATHKTNADLLTRGNIMNNCWGGIDIRVNKASCVGDKVYNPTYGVLLRGNVSDLNIQDLEVYNSFNAVYGATEVEGINRNLKITNLVSKGNSNDAVKITLTGSTSIDGLDILDTTLSDTLGEGVSLTGAITDVLIDSLKTKRQLATRYGVRLSGITNVTVSNSNFTGRPVRAEANGSVASSGIKVLSNKYTGDYVPLAATSGTTNTLSIDNTRTDVSASLGITNNTITASTGLGYGVIYVGSATTLSTITGAVERGELLYITKAGSGTLTINNSGNIAVPAEGLVLTDNDTLVTLVYTGTKWVAS